MRRDLQAVIGTRANINIAQIENYGGETFLSEELAIHLLQEMKQSFQRCQTVSTLIFIIIVLVCYLKICGKLIRSIYENYTRITLKIEH